MTRQPPSFVEGGLKANPKPPHRARRGAGKGSFKVRAIHDINWKHCCILRRVDGCAYEQPSPFA
jgi:hypothetical protein